MATADVQIAPAMNGLNGHLESKANGKIKSKNQLRRQKLKQKKAAQAVAVQVRQRHILRFQAEF
jgi:splicing factor 3B subunit 2